MEREEQKSCVDRISDRFNAIDARLGECIVSIGKWMNIEELTRSAVLDQDASLSRAQGAQIQALMREASQLLKVITYCGLYMLVLTVIYFIQTVYQLYNLQAEDFKGQFSNKGYDWEVFEYSRNIEYMKLVHSISLASIAIFMVMYTKKFKVLNKAHYHQIIMLTALVTIVYILPVIYICWISYKDAGSSFLGYREGRPQTRKHPDWQIALTKFADWIIMMVERSDLGWFGFTVSCLVHLQIYFLLFAMQWTAQHVEDIAKRIRKQRDSDSGTYNAMELMMGATDATVTQEREAPATSFTLSDGTKIESSSDETQLLNSSTVEPEESVQALPEDGSLVTESPAAQSIL